MARFCGNCGQSRHDHSRSLTEILRELLEHHLFLDGKMVMTLVALLFRPGVLTRAFIEGRRVRYVSPIRLYLFTSFAFFFALWASGFAMIQFHIPPAMVEAMSGESPSAPERGPREATASAVIEVLSPARGGEAMPDAIKSQLDLKARFGAEAHSDQDLASIDFFQRVADGFQVALAHPRALNPVLDDWLPRLLILTLPLTALLLALFGRKRGLYFVDHVSFALHLQAFVFALGLIVILVRLAWPDAALSLPLLLIFLVYSYLAYLRTYPGNRLWAALKLGIIGGIYGASLVIDLVALLVYGIWTLPGA